MVLAASEQGQARRMGFRSVFNRTNMTLKPQIADRDQSRVNLDHDQILSIVDFRVKRRVVSARAHLKAEFSRASASLHTRIIQPASETRDSRGIGILDDFSKKLCRREQFTVELEGILRLDIVAVIPASPF